MILREGNIVLMGEEKNVDLALRLMNELHDTVLKGKSLDKQSITYSLSLLLEGSEQKIKEFKRLYNGKQPLPQEINNEYGEFDFLALNKEGDILIMELKQNNPSKTALSPIQVYFYYLILFL